ncbi:MULTISPECIES: hypothetical protein [Parachlamydia]|jgi:hypothetical protein|uniref:Uncharacterized protein n=2 Tax=Parachlamydia acanthamoebae TaxID=83552 RepID=F8KYT1_PARAV|nr:hypothetical protein [Parachlamydia acanthamoebae]CCB86039.1 putative uncharacterized protein [Parachlamydia acanthamoebae UV-7]
MDFSITKNLLSGSTHRPDLVTQVTVRAGEDVRIKVIAVSKLNRLGYIPIISSFSGTARAGLGSFHTVVHLSCAIVGNRKHNLLEAKLGAKNVARGLVEMIPLIGNVALFLTDTVRLNIYHSKALDIIDDNRELYDGHYVIFNNEKEYSMHPLT